MSTEVQKISKESYSPMMSKYLETKEKYPDCILMYRLGDFYEMFFDDALEASKILDITLTGKKCGVGDERAPMCGVPYHAVDAYISKLVNAGKKVAICEQREMTEEEKDAEKKAGNKANIMQRNVVRIITAGTAIESDILPVDKNNYLSAVYKNGENIGIAFCDVSTGDFNAFESKEINAIEEILLAFSPSEVLCNSDGLKLNSVLKPILNRQIPKMSLYYDWTFDVVNAQKSICDQYEISSLRGFGLEKLKCATSACGAIIEYLKETQKRNLPHLKNIKIVNSGEYMSIDASARKNLELFANTSDNGKYGSMLWLLDKTKTAMGSRKLHSWIARPLQNPVAIRQRLDAVEELCKDFITRETLLEFLSKISDVERLCTKLVYNTVMPRDLIALETSLAQIPKILSAMEKVNSKLLKTIISNIVVLNDVVDKISVTIKHQNCAATTKEGGYIDENFNAELKELLSISKNSTEYLNELKQKEIERTGIKTLKIGYNRVFGYFFEVSNSFKDLIPENYIRRQSLANGERFVTNELRLLEEKILTAKDSSVAIEFKIFQELCENVKRYIPQIQQTSNAIAVLDVLLSFSKVALLNNYCKPQINTSDNKLQIKNGRHPLVEKFLKREEFTPNDVNLDTEKHRTMILTGPNMAGKSTYMRQVALIVFMAHIGSFVPASAALVPITDKIFTRIGASDDITSNHSTFMVEMAEVTYILNNATSKSLIILDEVGRGTATFDGLSIAWAIMEYISQRIRAKTLFATHYHELTELEGRLDGVVNFKISIKEINGTIVFLHKIVPGGANRSFGIEVAQLAGMPEEVTQRAKSILSRIEKTDINKNVFNNEDLSIQEKQAKISKKALEIFYQIKNLNINTIPPIVAFDILNNLCEATHEEE